MAWPRSFSVSWITGRACDTSTVISLSLRKSMQNRSVPSFFFWITGGELYGEEVDSIIPLANISGTSVPITFLLASEYPLTGIRNGCLFVRWISCCIALSWCGSVVVRRPAPVFRLQAVPSFPPGNQAISVEVIVWAVEAFS